MAKFRFIRIPASPLAVLLRTFHLVSEVAFARIASRAASRFAPELHVPDHFLLQLFAIEDKRFLFHPGIDPFAIVRAGISNLTGATTLQGGSTITQQLYNV